ncbi:MAG: S8 family serine peptidase [Bdellovibrionales bacterium]|nr:S8 family serine peptidase [Bdellovibrionales bacterium]
MQSRTPNKLFILLGTSLVMGSTSAWAVVDGAHHARVESVPGEYIVKTRHLTGFAAQSLDRSLSARGLRVVETLSAQRDIYLVRADKSRAGVRAMDVSSLLREMSEVEIMEPNFIYHAAMGSKKPTPAPTPDPTPAPAPGSAVPNDSLFSSLWGMYNSGQKDSAGKTGVGGADISATKAWTISKGSRNVVVAVVDTGFDYTHPDLKDNAWSKAGQPTVHGYNAITDKLDPMDDNLHGTHCSGTIGAVGDNGAGVAGVNWNVSIMGVKFLDKNGSGTTADAIKAIDWARENGAQVISASWGGGGSSDALEESIARATEAGIVFVAAAGNDSGDNDSSADYPANYPGVVAVASSNNRDQMSDFSNYGAKTVDLMAPGENILSTVPGNKYKTLSGTSMATPHVSGAVALALSVNPSLTPAQVKQALRDSVDKVAAANGKTVSGGRLNVNRLLETVAK